MVLDIWSPWSRVVEDVGAVRDGVIDTWKIPLYHIIRPRPGGLFVPEFWRALQHITVHAVPIPRQSPSLPEGTRL